MAESWGQSIRDWTNVHPALASLAGAFIVMTVVGLGIVVMHHDDSGAKLAIEAHINIDSHPSGLSAPPEPKVVYDPPSNKQVYKKYVIEGEISTVEYMGSEPYVSDEKEDKHHNPSHYMPDFTRVTYFPPGDDAKEESYDFCGNLLKLFTPSHKLRMVIEESKYGDYNGCLILPGHNEPLTFGGKPQVPKQ